MSLSTKNDHPEFELHQACEQEILFVIEALDYDLKWRPALSSQFRVNGKFILYDRSYIVFFNRKEEGPELKYKDEQVAKLFIKKLARLSERPLRVQRVQTVRIQRTIGKVYLPTGGV